MTPFTTLTAIAAAIPRADIDTDMLFPAAFMKTVSRRGLSRALFHTVRASDPAFPLDNAPWDNAGILIGLDNFGCGSSREHAPWALLDFGIRCIVAPSFADIFRTNCVKNGILPIALPRDEVVGLMIDAQDPARALLTVDLDTQTITRTDGATIAFAIEPESRRRLLDGTDDISMSLGHADAIRAHERRAVAEAPWLRPIPATLP